MTPTEVTTILRKFNEWRRGDDETIEQPDPREIGEAIDAAVGMIDRLEAAEEIVRELERKLSSGMWRVLREENEALRARIEEMEKQEPVAWVRKLGLDLPSVGCVTDLKYRPSDIPESSYIPLYLAPGAQPAPSVPDGWKLVPIEPTREMLDAGEDTFVSALSGTPTSSPIAVYRAMLSEAPEAKP